MILETERFDSNGFSIDSFITVNQLLKILEKDNEYREELKNVFHINEEATKVIQVGNAKSLVYSLLRLNSECDKIDIVSAIKDIELKRLLEDEKAILGIYSITDKNVLQINKSDILEVETKYSSKNDFLDYYHFSKFANYCRDLEYDDLIRNIYEYLKRNNRENTDVKKLRLVYKYSDGKFYLRAITSAGIYKNYGTNFSVFVALLVLTKYFEDSKNEVYIDHYVVDDSNLHVSFSLSQKATVSEALSIEFKLILENDEIKRESVSFNGLCKLIYNRGADESEIFIKPRGLKLHDDSYPVDLLSYKHVGDVKSVFNKMQELPKLINFFITQVREDSVRISKITQPDEIRKYLKDKASAARKEEFKAYKGIVVNKLASITVDNIFGLFKLLQEVEKLFNHDDIVALDYWRTKIYETLIEKE
jgi:hypothetical protein